MSIFVVAVLSIFVVLSWHAVDKGNRHEKAGHVRLPNTWVRASDYGAVMDMAHAAEADVRAKE